ncbi:MAG TPA: VOC family protein [Thermoplasmata archaeon]|nr:VOC family protein [Thermoplasmata archaeon]
MIALADVAVVVSDAKASAEWWQTNLGFASYTVGGSGHALLVAPPGDRFVLHLCEGFAPLEPGDTGIAFVTDEMDPLLARMRKGAVRFPTPPTKQEWGTMAKFADPDGNIFWLLEAPSAMVRSTAESRAPSSLPVRSGAGPAARRRSRRTRAPRAALPRKLRRPKRAKRASG